ncbi:MAG: chemotaxis protein CheW [Fischerella sp.]|jgi:positive phototaxis protein PixI|uniref:chemotaxis protein CheW n=1 Tax=Fischerella sp. TaxID=1191 RepID=UPI00183B8286|nr:chemotaxis protein CheW [Fischerella sp.]NWF61041.1 chemotaxis protein CheW [Fischerella sp.]
MTNDKNLDMFAQTFVNSIATSFDPLILDQLPPERPLSRLIRFPLGSQDSALLPLEQIAEILRIDVAEILPVPQMPSCVLGIGNWRGEMLWLVDLNHLVGYPPLTLAAGVSPIAMVVQVNGQSVGLVVEKVNDIESHDLEKLHPPSFGLFPGSLLPFVLGYLPGDRGNVLDVAAIAGFSLWQSHKKTEG